MAGKGEDNRCYGVKGANMIKTKGAIYLWIPLIALGIGGCGKGGETYTGPKAGLSSDPMETVTSDNYAVSHPGIGTVLQTAKSENYQTKVTIGPSAQSIAKSRHYRLSLPKGETEEKG